MNHELLTMNFVQSTLNDYAKQTQFKKCPNGCKFNEDND